MPTTTNSKRKRPPDAEVLARRAQAAWEYRQRNRAIVNEKARVRTQKRREALKKAPSDVQQEAIQKARQYRRNYIRRVNAGSSSSPATQASPRKAESRLVAPRQAQVAALPAPPAPPPAAKLRPAPAPFCSSPGKIADLNLLRPRPPSSAHRASTPLTPTPPSRKRQLATPRSLAAIDAEDDDSPDEGEESEDEQPLYTGHRISSIKRWWEYLDADGPLLNVTGHPDYVPERSQQPYFKGGRRYWF
ncbi:hypothetical protein C8F04DRAFT_1280887 [Mycena alexandri]|uniref:Uncharacterized protein n=1 Tax=Mycena alexandri TaxID=1745969 RepID=A0AAD6RXG0_9AGAR|nr:hypothetical protein C8F04DRAFT_1280887 [Mycena alexandri]